MSLPAEGNQLVNVVVLLGAAVVAVPLFKRLGLGSVLGYLAAGLAIGPFGICLLYTSTSRASPPSAASCAKAASTCSTPTAGATP